jgi:hypothetical protein
MTRASSKTKSRVCHEWNHGNILNVGVTHTYPVDIIFGHVRDKDIRAMVNLFFDNETKCVTTLDLCVFEQYWWVNSNILHARYCKITHPTYFSGEYIFDFASGERTIIEVRQPDIDGKHWNTNHIHIIRGLSHPVHNYIVDKPSFNKHVELIRPTIKGLYFMRIFDMKPPYPADTNRIIL